MKIDLQESMTRHGMKALITIGPYGVQAHFAVIRPYVGGTMVGQRWEVKTRMASTSSTRYRVFYTYDSALSYSMRWAKSTVKQLAKKAAT
jgi:hypothetical protein